MPGPEQILVMEHMSYPEPGAPELVEHFLVTGRNRDEVTVAVSEVGLVKRHEEFSVVSARRIGGGAMHVLQIAVPRLRGREEVEREALRVTEEILATDAA